MLKKLSHALLWIKVMARSRDGKISEALDALSRIDEQFGLRPYEEVFKYSLILRNGEYAAAENAMQAFIIRNAASSNDNTRYSICYCEYILNGIRGDLDQKKASRARAMAIRCDAGVKRWLPL
jgi:outer membrane protein assembly factor BamD (BamD/ComL family)